MWDSDFTSDKTFGSEPKDRFDYRMMCRRSHDWTRRRGELPRSVSAFVGFLAGRGSFFFTTQSFASTASPSVAWSAFDLGRVRARVRGLSAATDEALASYDETVLRALEETENSFSNYQAQQDRLVKLSAQAQESKPAPDIARLRYRKGVIDFLYCWTPSVLSFKRRTRLPKASKMAFEIDQSFVCVLK